MGAYPGHYGIIIIMHFVSHRTNYNYLTFHTGYLNTNFDAMIAVEPSFGEENITLTVTLDGIQSMIGGLTFGATFTSSFGEIINFSGGNDAGVELIMLYNIKYNLTAFTALCGYENQLETLSLFYSEYSVCAIEC